MPAEGINDFKMSGVSRVSGMNTAEKVSPRAMRIMDLHLQGMRSIDIAKELDLTPRYVGKIINAPNFQHALAIRRHNIQEHVDKKIVNTAQEAVDELKTHAKKAAQRLVALLDSDSETTMLKSSTEILDRVGVISQKKGGNDAAPVVIINKEAAILINETLKMDKSEEGDEK